MAIIKVHSEEGAQSGNLKGQFFRTKRKAQELIEGTHREQYNWIWSYCAKVKRVMPNSTVLVHKEEKNEGVYKFKRMYCCLGPPKEGVKRVVGPSLEWMVVF